MKQITGNNNIQELKFEQIYQCRVCNDSSIIHGQLGTELQRRQQSRERTQIEIISTLIATRDRRR